MPRFLIHLTFCSMEGKKCGQSNEQDKKATRSENNFFLPNRAKKERPRKKLCRSCLTDTRCVESETFTPGDKNLVYSNGPLIREEGEKQKVGVRIPITHKINCKDLHKV